MEVESHSMSMILLNDLAFWSFAALMLSVAFIDFRKLIIPNALLLVGSMVAMLLATINSWADLSEALLAGFVCVIVLAAIREAGNKLLRRESMGMGDVKLAGVIGLFIGFLPFLIALWIASIAGAGYGLAKVRLTPPSPFSIHREGGVRGMSGKVPFGGFLAISSVAVFPFRDEILQILQSWSWLTLNP